MFLCDLQENCIFEVSVFFLKTIKLSEHLFPESIDEDFLL